MKVLVNVFRNALGEMLQEVARFPDVESGGILLGSVHEDYWAAATKGYDHVVNIAGATDGGPKAHRSRLEFERDADHCQALLVAAYEKSAGTVGYVGEWHRHCSGNAAPSGYDRAALAHVCQTPAYAQPKAIFLIVAVAEAADLADRQLRAWAWNPATREVEEAEVQLQPGFYLP